jgi:hypothetical protein
VEIRIIREIRVPFHFFMERSHMPRWLPNTTDPLLTGRARLILATCVGLILAVWGLVLTWLISGDLQIETVVVMIIFSLILLGMAAVSRSGRVMLAAWLLIALLGLAVVSDVAYYGVGAPGIFAFVLPIVLAACLSGLAGGMIMAVVGASVAWGVAIGAMQGWLAVAIPFQMDHLTFNAPVISLIFLLVALIVGWWSRYTANLIRHA